jgi:hypothetical protein
VSSCIIYIYMHPASRRARSTWQPVRPRPTGPAQPHPRSTHIDSIQMTTPPQPSSFPISFSLFSALPIPIQISGWSLRVLEDGRQQLGSPFAEEVQVCDGKVRRRQSRSSISARRARTQFAREQVRFQRGDVCCAEICCTKPPTRL